MRHSLLVITALYAVILHCFVNSDTDKKFDWQTEIWWLLD